MKKILILLTLIINLTIAENYSFDFSSGSYGKIAMSESLSNFDEFTMEFWYYETGGHGSDEMIVGTEFFAGSKYGVYSFIDGFWPYIYDGENFLGIGYDGSNGSAGISYISNAWYHIALTYDGSIFKFFVNGESVYEQEGDMGLFGSENEDLVINRHTWGSGSSSRLSGQIDELRISNIARYSDDFTPPNYEFLNDTSTAGLWHFNNDFNDSSDNENHGQHNGTSYSSNTPNFIDPIFGCMDSLANNYNSEANIDDGSCSYIIDIASDTTNFTYGGTYDGKYYYISNYETNFDNALAISASYDGYLTVISSSGENSFVVDMLSSHVEYYAHLGYYIRDNGWQWV